MKVGRMCLPYAFPSALHAADEGSQGRSGVKHAERGRKNCPETTHGTVDIDRHQKPKKRGSSAKTPSCPDTGSRGVSRCLTKHE